MPVDLTEVRQLFFEESFENLDVMESSLLELEVGTVDKELINNIFRAAHSIKGGAGIFKLDQIIDFAHITETLLDEMRNGEHLITQSLIDLLLRAVDAMRIMLSSLSEDTDYNAQEIVECQQQLQQALKNSTEAKQASEPKTSKPMAKPIASESIASETTTPDEDNSTTPSITTKPTQPSVEETSLLPPSTHTTKNNHRNWGWQISFKPESAMLKTGNDPINLFRELARLGELEVKVNTAQLPTLEEIEPQNSYFSWELILQTEAERAEIDEIFEWVVDESDLQIIPLLGEQPLALAQVSPEVASVKPVPPKHLELQPAQSTKIDKREPEQTEEENLSTPESPPAKTLDSTESQPDTEYSTSKTVNQEPVPFESSAAEKTQKIEKTIDSQAENDQQFTKLTHQEPVKKEPNSQSIQEPEKISTPAPNTTHEPITIHQPKSSTVTVTSKEKVNGSEVASHHTSESSSIRVNIDKIDILINLVGELVITQSMLDQIGENFENSRISQLRDGLSQLERNTRELQESVMRIRMLPISYSFNRFPRLVHDLSVQLGKKVELKLSGEHTELDKTVLEKMSDPLVHLVRNALDHGIETPERRRLNNKSETGRLHLHAYHQGGNIIIQISDDGAGFDLTKIRQKAISKGLLNPDDHVTDEQLHEFIFLPGFSTAEQVSDLSGRGVGMDVVRRNIRALGGTIEVKSQPGKGSTFSIRLPLTLAILDGQLVRVGEEIYILPLLSILESLRVNPKLVSSMTGRAEVYRLRDEYIPILRLYSLFDVTPGTTQLDQGLLVIVEGDGQKIGLFVDELLSQQQIVIKSLETNYKQIQGISGATILGDGSVALILDIAGLISLFHREIGKPSFRPSFFNRSAS
jgi:two-component system chemotaxis sensor kinase CheA